MMRKTLLLLAATVACAFSAQARKTYTLSSPEGRLQTTVAADDALTYAVTFDGRPVLDASPLSLTLDDGTTWGVDPRVAGVSRTSVDAPPISRPRFLMWREAMRGISKVSSSIRSRTPTPRHAFRRSIPDG